MGHERTRDYVPWEDVYESEETNPGVCSECNGHGVLTYTYPKGTDEEGKVEYDIGEEPCPKCSKY